MRAVTIADADEKLFMCWHTLCRVSSCDTPGSVEILHLCGIDPFLIHLHPLFKVTRPVRMGQLAISDLVWQAKFYSKTLLCTHAVTSF